MRDEIDPILVSREDEANGGLIPGKFTSRNGLMRKRGRNVGEIQRDRLLMGQMKARMASLWADGATYQEIATRVSDDFELQGDERIGASNIHYHIKQMLSYWREKGLVSIDERQAMTLARYAQLEEIAMEAYFASCEGKKTSNFEKQVTRGRSREREALLLKAIKKEREGKKRHRLVAESNTDDGGALDNLELMDEKIKRYRRTESNPAGDPRWISLLIDINDKRAKLWGLINRADMTNGDQELARLPDEVREQKMAALLQQAATRRDKNRAGTPSATYAPLGGFKKETETKVVVPEILPPDTGWDDDEDEDDSWE